MRACSRAKYTIKSKIISIEKVLYKAATFFKSVKNAMQAFNESKQVSRASCSMLECFPPMTKNRKRA
jgi:hypothetical protein